MKFMILFIGCDEARAQVDPEEEKKACAAAGKSFEDLTKGGLHLARADRARARRR